MKKCIKKKANKTPTPNYMCSVCVEKGSWHALVKRSRGQGLNTLI